MYVQDGYAESVLGVVQRASVVAEVVAGRQKLGVLRQHLHIYSRSHPPLNAVSLRTTDGIRTELEPN